MNQYVAFLRGITPSNPNMRNEKLRSVFENLGFSNVRTVISSGNVLFDPPAGGTSRNTRALEDQIEAAWSAKLGFKSTTIIRNRHDLEKLISNNPFGNLEHSQKSSLNVTFLKNPPAEELKVNFNFPYKVEGRDYTLLGMYDGAICSVLDLTSTGTPDLMLWLEKQFGKEITTRTWNTVNKIHKIL